MSYTDYHCKGVKHSSFPATPTERNTVSIQSFEAEKRAKNIAYHFILSHHLLPAFQEFCHNYTEAEPHEACIRILNGQIEEK